MGQSAALGLIFEHMRNPLSRTSKLIAFMACSQFAMSFAAAADAGAKDAINPPPTLSSWTALSKLPDFSGVWTPVISDQVAQERSNPPPWKPAIAKQVEHLYAEEKAGRPALIFDHCFPEGMPSYMLITHNAFEILMTPGRLTLLGEGDGNRMRRIYTDGRTHAADPIQVFTENPSATGRGTLWWWIPPH